MNRKFQVLSLLCVLIVMVGMVVYRSHSSSASAALLEWRIADVEDYYKGEPIPIVVTKIEQSGKEIKFGEKFRAPEQVLENAKISLRNLSKKDIRAVLLTFTLVNPQTGRIVAKAPAIRLEDKTAIKPGAEGAGTISPLMVSGLIAVANKTGVALSNTKLEVSLVEFTDDTGWAFGSTVVRNPNSPVALWAVEGKELAAAQDWRLREQGVHKLPASSSAFYCGTYFYSYVSECGPQGSGCYTVVELFGQDPNEPRFEFDQVTNACFNGSYMCVGDGFRIVGGCL